MITEIKSSCELYQEVKFRFQKFLKMLNDLKSNVIDFDLSKSVIDILEFKKYKLQINIFLYLETTIEEFKDFYIIILKH